jgi:hypothetical protein
MKKFIVEFLKRGAIFAGLGPLILAIVYFFLHLNGVVEMVPVTKMIAEIISSLILAFIAAGISAVYHVEKLQLGIAGLLQGSVLFADYIFFYLAMGWMPFRWDVIALFTAIFVVIFALIWLIVYLSIRNKIKKINEKLC